MNDINEAIARETPIRLNPADPRSWDQQAICNEYSDDPAYSWCGERAQSRTEERIICWTRCPVRRDCLTWAIIQGEKHCIYGGFNYGERRAIRAAWETAGIMPDPEIYPRIPVDPDEILRLITEASISRYGDMPNPMFEFDEREPNAFELAAIEEEESD